MIQRVSIAVFAVMTSVAAKNIKRTICLVFLLMYNTPRYINLDTI